MHSDNLTELKSKHICANCTGEKFLKAHICQSEVVAECDYCSENAPCITIKIMAEFVRDAFERHYVRTPTTPSSFEYALISDKESDYEWERSGDEAAYAIADAAEIPEVAAEDVREVLAAEFYDHESAKAGDETEFAPESHYERKHLDDRAWQASWRHFERILKTEARFFSRAAAGYLASIFERLDNLRTQDGQRLILEVGPGTNFVFIYRARAFQSDDDLKKALVRPDLHLGPPPPHLARAGRMNAQGISVFYGASDPQVAIAEVRPPVGSNVAVAKFEIVKSLRVLNLSALQQIVVEGSVFDPMTADSIEHAIFLDSLSSRITKPVMPDDEAFEYLVTQAIADFLATEQTAPLDGIIYPSVQVAGNSNNIVLFQKAARVEELSIPKNAKLSVDLWLSTADGWEREISVTEEVPPSTEASETHQDWQSSAAMFLVDADELSLRGSDNREVCIRILPQELKVHEVTRVSFESTEFPVHRHRWARTGGTEPF